MSSAPLSIPLAVFADFVCSTGRRRVSIVRDFKLGRGYDFYAPFVAEIQAMHQRAGTLRPGTAAHQLPDLVGPLAVGDQRKARIYPKLAQAYARVLAGLGPTTFGQGPWQAGYRLPLAGDVEATITADLGVVVEQDMAAKPRLYLLSFHMAAEPLAEHRAVLLCFLLLEASGATHENTVCGVLDVPRSRVVTPTLTEASRADLRVLVRAEALCFRSLWESVVVE